jgi:hypothetical protein
MNAPGGATYPLLTPSGRAFAAGGRVQNISRDPMVPCIMYWPENEPLPEAGQMRPASLTGMPVRVYSSFAEALVSYAYILSFHSNRRY